MAQKMTGALVFDERTDRYDISKKHKYQAYALGNEPITIGLWIGGTHIPNKNTGSKNSAEYHLNELISVSAPYYIRSAKERHNKFQVLKCPWCGTKMVKDEKGSRLVGTWGYAMRGKHFYMHCPHEECHFTARLPIQIIDDELYDTPPTLLFGTVDKFAMMPWDGRIGAFFSVGSNNRTPELIIQDELHLISGALGTIVGLYETAVDALCSQKGIRPKIIASTATIRKAKEQCSVLYNRDVMQFPAPGIDADDSFFAKEAPIDYAKGMYGRKYVGVILLFHLQFPPSHNRSAPLEHPTGFVYSVRKKPTVVQVKNSNNKILQREIESHMKSGLPRSRWSGLACKRRKS